jgi:hypothetical protein
MGLISKRGIVSGVSLSATTTGRNGNTVTTQDYAWRMDNVQCITKSGTNVGISDGDEIIAVGKMKNGFFKVMALKNLTTGTEIKSQFTIPLIIGICFAVLGVLTLIFIVGLLLLPVGIYIIYDALKGNSANKMLDSLVYSSRVA